MQQDVAMKHKGARNRRIAKIHAHLHAVVWMAGTFPERNLDGIAQILIRSRLSVHLQHFEVNLVHVEGVGLERAILHDPVFNRAHVSRDHRFFIRFKHFFFLSIDGDVELYRTVGPAKFLGEVKIAHRGRLHCVQSGEFYRAYRWATIGVWRRSRLRLLCIRADLDLRQFLLKIGIARRTS